MDTRWFLMVLKLSKCVTSRWQKCCMPLMLLFVQPDTTAFTNFCPHEFQQSLFPTFAVPTIRNHVLSGVMILGMPFVQTKQWFLNTNLYDSYQLNTLNGLPNGPPWTGAKRTYAEDFRSLMEATISREVAPSDDSVGAFAASCYAHGDTLSAKFTSVQVGGVSLQDALLSWFYGDASAPRISVDGEVGGNGNPTC